jgi:hypothetical protein
VFGEMEAMLGEVLQDNHLGLGSERASDERNGHDCTRLASAAVSKANGNKQPECVRFGSVLCVRLKGQRRVFFLWT